eukprot:5748461-Alexandrium_andersonii.AAC.1
MCIRDSPRGGHAANRCKPLQTAASGLQRLAYVCRYTFGAGRLSLGRGASGPASEASEPLRIGSR